MRTKIIAHRGASFITGEDNSLKSFACAISIKADYVEFDIRRTLDNKLIVFHDNEVGGVEISKLNYRELNDIIYEEKGFKVPLLVEVLKLCKGKIKLDIELKEGGYEKRVIKMVTSMYGYEEFMMKSFIDNVVARIKIIDPNITTGLLVGCKNGDIKRRLNEYFPERRLRACKCDFVASYYRFTTVMFIARMRFFGYKIYVWTVNNKRNIRKFIKRGVTGVITDKPDLVTSGKFIIERKKQK